MQLIKCRYKLRCEISDCKSFADYTVYTRRTGVRNSLHLCKGCLLKLNELVQQEIVPQPSDVTPEQGEQTTAECSKADLEVQAQPKKRVGGNGKKSKQ